jgi:rRNA maturation endonuclease Nob1
MTGVLVLQCHGCGNVFEEARGALSRYDNKTLVCSDCGTEEGMAQFVAMSNGINPKSVLMAPAKVDWAALAEASV